MTDVPDAPVPEAGPLSKAESGAESDTASDAQSGSREIPKTRDPGFWDAYYEGDEAPPWQLDAPCPPVFAMLERDPELTPGRILVPGCGLGHEPIAFARRGFTVVGLDLAPRAVEGARRRASEAGVELEMRQGSILEPPADLLGGFDYVFEQTCFCAIDPSDRDAYIAAVHDLLKPGGRLIGVFYDFEGEEGPPFPTTDAEVRERFTPRFVIEHLARATDSHERRAGREWLAKFRRS